MSEFGWTRLAQLTITLAVLAVLVKLGSLGLASVSQDFLTSASRFIPEATTEETVPAKDPEDLAGYSKLTSPDSEETTNTVSVTSDRESSHSHSNGGQDKKVQNVYKNVNFSGDAPVFYRPSVKSSPEKKARKAKGSSSTGPSATSSGRSSTPPVSSRASGGKVCKNVNAAPEGAKIVFPLAREYFDSYDDTWGAARPQGGHEGADLMTPGGVPEFALTDGTVATVSGSNANGWNTLGGYTVMVEADYSVGPVRKGDLFYYAHMNGPTDLRVGDRVKAGDVVGYTGDTGQGPEGTTGLFPTHLHLGWYDVSSGRSQLASGAMNPYPLLEWIKSNGGSIEGGSNAPYCEAPQPSSPTPSSGGYWQFPSDPGVRPDIDTGEETVATPVPNARPIPSAESSPNIQQEQTVEVIQNQTNQTNQNQQTTEVNEANGTKPPKRPDRPQGGANPQQATPRLPDRLDDIRGWIDSMITPRPDRPDKPKPDDSNTPNKPRPVKLEKPEPNKPNKPGKPDDSRPQPGKPKPKPGPEETAPDEVSPGDETCAVEGESAPPGAAGKQYSEEKPPGYSCAEEDPAEGDPRPETDEPRKEDPKEPVAPAANVGEETLPEETVSEEVTSGETTPEETTSEKSTTYEDTSAVGVPVTPEEETTSPETTTP